MKKSLIGQQMGRYTVQELLLQRAASSLYLGRETATDAPVFLEIMHATATADPTAADTFRRRMEIAAQLNHPAIAPVLHVGQSAGKRPFAAIKHQPGVFLAERLEAWRALSTRRSPVEALTLVQQLAAALAVAHPAGLIHHDLRPATIYLQADDTPWLIDLGVVISPLEQSLDTLRTTQRLDYASPEQLQGQALSGRSNVYSLGVLLFELLAGSRPRLHLSEWDIFDRQTLPKEESLEDARGGLRRATYDVARNCLWHKEWNRYNTAQELVQALEAAIAAERSIATAVPSAASRQPDYRVYLALALVLLLLIAIVLAVLLLR